MTRRLLDIGVLGSVVLLAAAGLGWTAAQPGDQPAVNAVFRALDVVIDSGESELAAYQFELRVPKGVELVGVENGEHPAFAKAPYYDPRALGGGRIIIAAFDTGDDLPTGKTRVCRVHVRETVPGARYNIKLTVAADADGRSIEADIEIHEE
ncbi:MAG: hypothetical protein IH985_09020 [Planctomycetes bacterium]|nr:hypothetical protein [Planctomycetota bacterium]